MAFVADVQRSVDFYRLLGMEVRGSVKTGTGDLQWAHVGTGCPQPTAVLFYLYSPNVVTLREHLRAEGVHVSSITYPDYMPKGEVRVEDPDGYTLLIGQAG
jgi:catechol 2,3-dioxygenase-like lactoylglutathione lyase family enzyme